MGTHTYRQTLKYEIARDLLNGRIAHIAEQIDIEEAKPGAASAMIEQLENSMAAVGVSISQLDIRNEAGLDAIITANRRTVPNECPERGDGMASC